MQFPQKQEKCRNFNVTYIFFYKTPKNQQIQTIVDQKNKTVLEDCYDTLTPLTDGIISSGLPLSNTFLCCWGKKKKIIQKKILKPVHPWQKMGWILTWPELTFCRHKGSFLFSSAFTSCWTTSFGVFTARTSFIVEPTTIIFAPFVTLISRSVLSSGSSPLYITFCIAGGRPAWMSKLIMADPFVCLLISIHCRTSGNFSHFYQRQAQSILIWGEAQENSHWIA